MTQPRFDVARSRRTILQALFEARAAAGGKTEILEDADRAPITFDRLALGTFVLGEAIKPIVRNQTHVGIMLPSSIGCTVAFFATHAIGRIPAMLNFTAGARNIRAACKMAEVRTILTSRRFVGLANLEGLVADLGRDFRVVYLEDVREKMSALTKITGALKAKLGAGAAPARTPDDPAVVLFTSGTEGAPKGVVLSHANLVANVEQALAHVPFQPDWVFFNPLPMFHCFGLTAGTLLPVLSGHKTFLYPSPLHIKQIPELIRQSGANVIFATDTFLNQYIRASGPDDLRQLQLAVCGAEKVREETHRMLAAKSPGIILEGYGATEASPIIACNKPSMNKVGTVGAIFQGMEYRLEPVPGLDPEMGRLLVKGPNVMLGYLRHDNPGVLERNESGWHDTGDVVTIDADGWIAIKGRVKRFAKIGGEMVSLAAVETYAHAIWPENSHVCVSIPDQRKGEQLVLVTDRNGAKVEALHSWAKENGVPELQVPKKIVEVPEIPVLGSGKTDYVSVQKLVQDRSQQMAA
jgi:acyl-[acyl-carrier-protein]-phospholipid O-acyltransferase/long-chain-fatty-acid--[acyl-carrier-protein] ligase